MQIDIPPLPPLEGGELDAAVAQAMGLTGWKHETYGAPNGGGIAFHYERDGPIYWSPSRDWRIGGPIIQSVRIELRPLSGTAPEPWFAVAWSGEEAHGPTPLIAAMRAYVASKA